MLDSLASLAFGFTVALQPQNLFYCFLGVTMGTLVGVLPGLGPTVTIALLLPVTFQLDLVAAIIMLSGICYGAMYGGSTTSILLNIPGEAASVVTCLDGYQMARQGDNKMKALPKVATASELGIKGDFLDSWAGCFVAAGTPKSAIDTLVTAANKVLKSKSYIERIEKTGGIAQYLSPSQFQAMIEKNRNTAIETAKREGLLAK